MTSVNNENPCNGAQEDNEDRTASIRSVRSTSSLECALALAELGVPTLPVSHPSMPPSPRDKSPGKAAILDAWQENASTDPTLLRRWFGSGRILNLGMLMGSASGLVVFDIDVGKGGFESWEALEQELGLYPMGPRARSGGGGLHIFGKYPEGHGRIKNATALGRYPGLDFKADHGYVVGPPSLHSSGGRYQWLENLALGEIDVPAVPDAYLRLILGQSKQVAPSSRSTHSMGSISEGNRNDSLFRRACSMRAQGAERDYILEALRTLNLSCIPPLEEGELAAIADSAAKYPPNIPLTDLGNARRLVAQHGQDIRFCIETGKWLVWTGQFWKQDYNA